MPLPDEKAFPLARDGRADFPDRAWSVVPSGTGAGGLANADSRPAGVVSGTVGCPGLAGTLSAGTAVAVAPTGVAGVASEAAAGVGNGGFDAAGASASPERTKRADMTPKKLPSDAVAVGAAITSGEFAVESWAPSAVVPSHATASGRIPGGVG